MKTTTAHGKKPEQKYQVSAKAVADYIRRLCRVHGVNPNVLSNIEIERGSWARNTSAGQGMTASEAAEKMEASK